MTLYDLKPRFQNALRPLAGRLAARGVTANQVTLAAALGSIRIGALVAALAEARILFLLLPLWFVVRMGLNAIDGMLAREKDQQTKLGAYLNEIGDIVSDAALYLPFALIFPFGPFWVGLAILLAALTEFAGVLAASLGATRRYDGPLGKSDRALVFGAVALWVAFDHTLPPWAVWVMIAVKGLLILTVFNRVRAGLRAAPPSAG